jgi:tetratricopeptide (TPR) repeat protein
MLKAKPRVEPVRDPRTAVWIGLGLLAAVLFAYGQVLHFDFVSYDDPDYVTANPNVQAGLTWTGVAWVFRTGFAGNWFPLTWLSHMLDCTLFGVDAGWHHFTNMCLHALATLIWFAVLKRMTGALWRSAIAAFLFGLHPLRVESVAWVAERKDVLSAFFWMATLWAYIRYVERPGLSRYVVTLVLFACGLMAKSMLVTLPVVLMLLDRWPLDARGAPQANGTRRRIADKLPFVVLAAAASVVTFLVHRQVGATVSIDLIPLGVRIENAVISYCAYILQMFWPANLSVFYPYPQGPLIVPALFAGAALTALTFAAMRAPRQRGYFTTGWLWYLVTLVPVIGLVQVGAQARADRYTYIPMAGLTIALVWGAAEILERRPQLRTAVAAAAIIACLALTWKQAGYWHDSISLYNHAIEATSENYVAHFNLATVLEAGGRPAEAIEQYREAVRIRPYFAIAHSALGQLLAKQGMSGEGLQELQTAVTLKPEDGDAHFRLGSALGSLGRSGEAASEFAKAVRLQPGNADAHFNFGIALAQGGRIQDAAREFESAVRLRPDDADARLNFGIALERSGRAEDAITQLSEALRLKPQSSEIRGVLEDARRRKTRPGR